MSDSPGQSQKAFLKNPQKLTPPSYVTNKIVEVVRSRRQKSQGRNERCRCQSGKKYKNCCGLPRLDPWLMRSTGKTLVSVQGVTEQPEDVSNEPI